MGSPALCRNREYCKALTWQYIAGLLKPNFLSNRSRAGAGGFFIPKNQPSPAMQERVFVFKDCQGGLKMDRRRFFVISTLPFVTVACGQNSSVKLPSSPTQVQPAPTPSTTYPLQAWWGERIGEIKTAGIEGTLDEVMQAARLDPQINNSGLLVSFKDASAPRGIIFLVNGQYHNQSVRTIHLKPGQTWAAYHFSGQT